MSAFLSAGAQGSGEAGADHLAADWRRAAPAPLGRVLRVLPGYGGQKDGHGVFDAGVLRCIGQYDGG